MWPPETILESYWLKDTISLVDSEGYSAGAESKESVGQDQDPEWQKISAQVASLYNEITRKALENEKGA